jgi:hypothetical protein
MRRGHCLALSLVLILPASSATGDHRVDPVAGRGSLAGPTGRADSLTGRPKFRLAPTPAGRPASGWVELAPSQSPFGVAATSDGRLVYDLDITATDLPAASDLGAFTHYEVWLTTPKLDVVRDLGPLQNNVTLHAHADWNKFTIIVSAEPTPVGRKWGTSIALIGRSPSSLMQSFASHPLFSVPEPD